MLARVARFIAPPHCLVCGREGAVACGSCLDARKLPSSPQCFRCNNYSREEHICAHCRRQTGVTAVAVGAQFSGTVRELIHQLKYRRLREAARPLAGLLTPLLSPIGLNAITAVPVATNRLRARGYNQAELIARALAQESRLPYRPLLKRLRNTQQVGKGRAERQQALNGVFMASPRTKGLKVLIVDDVITTGATMSACAQELYAAKAASVSVAAVARDE